jgi:hypothetical protein
MPGQFSATHGPVDPSDPGYVSIEEATRRELARKAEFEARPEIIARRKREAQQDAEIAARKAATKGKSIPTTDYPWLKPGWEW